jgi:hypothetical protein
MFEALEFQGVAAGVEEEHGGLLTGLAGEPDPRLQNEGNRGGVDPVGHRLKYIPGEQRTEVGMGTGTPSTNPVFSVGVGLPVLWAEI